MGLGCGFHFTFEHMLTRVDLVTQPVAYLVYYLIGCLLCYLAEYMWVEPVFGLDIGY